jgi:hypothetical protein
MHHKEPNVKLPARAAVAAFASVVAVGVAAGSPAMASTARPATTFAVQINATGLSTTKINIDNLTTAADVGPLDTTSVLSENLAAGQYAFNAGGADWSCQPTLTTSGTWNVPQTCGSTASATGADLTLTGVPVTLNASAIDDPIYVLSYGEPGVAPGATATRQLMPGSYDLQPGSGMVANCQFSVDASDGVSLSGCGTAASAVNSTIVFDGLPVTLNAAGLSTGVVLAAWSPSGVAAHKTATLQLMPSADGYGLVPSAGSDSHCYFTLANSGLVSVTHCGSSASASGSTVTFTGFPITLNATMLSTTKYVIEDALQLDSKLWNSKLVHTYRLLSARYGFGVGAGYVANFGWTVGEFGFLSYNPADHLFLGGKGTRKLIVKGFPIRINATALGKGTFTLDPDIFAPSYKQGTVHKLRLVPSGYGFTSTTNPPGPWPHNIGWKVTLIGTVALTKPHSSCGWAAGNALIVDCTPPTFTQVTGSPNPVDTDQPFKVTALECDRVADVHATGTMTFVDVTTGVTLGTVALTPSPAFINCGRAKIVDDEQGLEGKYRIRATYSPGGAIPVPASAPAVYIEKVLGD